MKPCLYMLGGINYKNGVISTCPRQGDQLVFQKDAYLPSDVFNHENFKKAREQLYNDIFPKGCKLCEEMEDIGAQSMRKDFILNKDNNFYRPYVKGDEIDYTQGHYAEQGLMKAYNPETHETAKEGLRHIEIRFSNACNFACLHCSKVFSSGWISKLKKYEPDKEDKMYDLKQLLGTEHRHGDDDDNEMGITLDQAMEICDDLIENFPNLLWIDFAGGELLYQKQFFPTLKRLAEHPNAKRIKISFHSNFNANFNVEELSEYLQPFNQSAILISVDAGRTFYSYFRHGGSWDQLKKNIQDYRKINQKTFLTTTCTASIYQMLDIYDVMDSFLDLGCEFDASIVQSPAYLDPSLIMLEFEKETLWDIERTRKLLDKYKNRNAPYWFNYIVKYIEGKEPNHRDYMRFLHYRKKSDMIWKQNFNDYFHHYQIVDDELVRA